MPESRSSAVPLFVLCVVLGVFFTALDRATRPDCGASTAVELNGDTPVRALVDRCDAPTHPVVRIADGGAWLVCECGR